MKKQFKSLDEIISYASSRAGDEAMWYKDKSAQEKAWTNLLHRVQSIEHLADLKQSLLDSVSTVRFMSTAQQKAYRFIAERIEA